MSVKERSPKNSGSITPPLKDGEEPTELLLSLVSSPLIDLIDRGVAQVFTAKDERGGPVVLAIFSGVNWDESIGLLGALAVPEQDSSVGSPGPLVLAFSESRVGSVGNSPRSVGSPEPGALAVDKKGEE